MTTKLSVLLLFGVNLMICSPVMALSSLDQTVVFNEQGKPDQGKKEAEKNPEDDCE